MPDLEMGLTQRQSPTCSELQIAGLVRERYGSWDGFTVSVSFVTTGCSDYNTSYIPSLSEGDCNLAQRGSSSIPRFRNPGGYLSGEESGPGGSNNICSRRR